MKKFKFMLLALAATAMIFTSCNEKENDDNNKTNTENNQGGNQGGHTTDINWQDNGNTLVTTFSSFDEDFNAQVNVNVSVLFDAEGYATSGTLSVTYPDATSAQQAYNELVTDEEPLFDPADISIQGRTITVDITDLVEGETKASVRAIIEEMFGYEDDDDDNGGNNQGGQGSADIDGSYLYFTENDETFQGANYVTYTVVIMNGYISFGRNIDYDGDEHDLQVVFVGTYTYQNGQYVATMHEEGQTQEYRFTFTVDGDELTFHYQNRDIVLEKQ